MGAGFTEYSTHVLICNEPCVMTSLTSEEIVCVTPGNQNIDNGDTTCDVTVMDQLTNATATITDGYTYSSTARVTGVSPARGGTAGGTTVTITGSGFG